MFLLYVKVSRHLGLVWFYFWRSRKVL